MRRQRNGATASPRKQNLQIGVNFLRTVEKNAIEKQPKEFKLGRAKLEAMLQKKKNFDSNALGKIFQLYFDEKLLYEHSFYQTPFPVKFKAGENDLGAIVESVQKHMSRYLVGATLYKIDKWYVQKATFRRINELLHDVAFPVVLLFQVTDQKAFQKISMHVRTPSLSTAVSDVSLFGALVTQPSDVSPNSPSELAEMLPEKTPSAGVHTMNEVQPLQAGEYPATVTIGELMEKPSSFPIEFTGEVTLEDPSEAGEDYRYCQGLCTVS